MTYLEGIVAHSVDHILEENLGGESVSMIDDGLSVGTIPAVHLHTPTATTQSPEQQNSIHHSLIFFFLLMATRAEVKEVLRSFT